MYKSILKMRKVAAVAACLAGMTTFTQAQTPDTNWYTANPGNNSFSISNADELAGLAVLVNNGTTDFSGKTITISNDISLANYQAGAGWTSIGRQNSTPFKGTFNGNGKKITGLKTNSNFYSDVGLFGSVIDGTVKNLGIENADVAYTSTSNVDGGILANYFSGGIVVNCWTSGTVNSSSRAGGIVGYNDGKIENCYSTANVNCNFQYLTQAGGIAGGNNGTISNCWSIGKVSSTSTNSDAYVGGITSVVNYPNGSVINCVALNESLSCSGGSTYTIFGRVVGRNDNVSTSINNNIAFDKMLDPSGDTVWSPTGATTINGADISALAINSDGTLGDRFVSDSGWTTQNGKLPGLFGNAVDMPLYLQVTFTITATAGTGGSINPSGVVTVNGGTDQPFTFTANSGYEISQVLIDNLNNFPAVAAGTYTFTNVSANHTIEVYFAPITGISEATAEKMTIYPNPTSGQLRVSGDIWDSGDREIRIFNVVGQVVFTSQLSKLSPETTIDISHLANGLYFLKVDGKTIKVIKE